MFISDQNEEVIIESQLVGGYNFENVMTAAVLGTYFKVPGEKVKKAIEGYRPSNNRSEVLKIGENTFVLDAYNANPASMRNALLSFSRMDAHKKIAILGDMKELGEFSKAEHKGIMELAISLNFNFVILVGNEFEATQDIPKTHFFPDVHALKKWLEQQQFSGVHFLVKGSRSVGLERIIKH